MRSLPGIARVSNGEVTERRGGVHKVQADAHSGRILDEGVVKPRTGGVDLKGSVADVGCFRIRSTGARDGQVGEISGFVVGVVGVVVFVNVHPSVHRIADVGVANDSVRVAAVVDVANHDARVRGRNRDVGEQGLTVLHPDAGHHGPRRPRAVVDGDALNQATRTAPNVDRTCQDVGKNGALHDGG